MSYIHRLLYIKFCKALSYWSKQRHISGVLVGWGWGRGSLLRLGIFIVLCVFFSLNFEGDLDFYVNKLIRVFVCLFGC